MFTQLIEHVDNLRVETKLLNKELRAPFEKLSQLLSKTISEARATSQTPDEPPKKAKEVSKKPPSLWTVHCTEVLFPAIKTGMGAGKYKGGFHMQVAGYLKANGQMNPSPKEVEKAIQFLVANPDYKSKTQLTRSGKNSVTKEVEVEVEPEPEVESEDDEPDPKEWEFKHKMYLKDQCNEVFPAEGKMKWLGTFDGKKIMKGTMSERVKSWLESQD